MLADRLHGLWLWFGTSVALAFVALALQLVTPLVLAAAIDQIASGMLSWGLQAYVAVAAAALLADGFGRIADVKWHGRLNFRLATDTLAKGLTLGLPGRARFERGDLIYRSVGDVGGAARLPQSFVTVSTGLLLAVGSVVALAFLHPSFVVAWFLCLVVATLVTKRVFRDLGKRQAALSSHSGRMVSLFLDALRGARTIQASNTVEREVERVCRPLRDVADGARDMEVSGGKGMAVMLLSGHGVVIATTCVGAVLLTKDAISLGMLLAALAYSRQAFSAAAGVVDNGWFHIAIGRSHASRVVEVLGSEEATPAPARPAPLPGSGPASVYWNGVGVRTADNEEAAKEAKPREGESAGALLRDVHLAAPAERTLALVGASGVGKTTLVSLVGRLVASAVDGAVAGETVTLVLCLAGLAATGVVAAFSLLALSRASWKPTRTRNSPWRKISARQPRGRSEMRPRCAPGVFLSNTRARRGPSFPSSTWKSRSARTWPSWAPAAWANPRWRGCCPASCRRTKAP